MSSTTTPRPPAPAQAPAAGVGAVLLERVLAGTPRGETPVTHVAELPARAARHTEWPDWVHPGVRSALLARGVARPWTHQVEAAQHAWAGRHVVVATGTASGKSLAYQLPVLTALLTEPRATALYLAPTKALGADQLRSVLDLGLPGVRAASYDGDTPFDERDWVRAHANLVLTNPDMLHLGMLSRHDRWARVLRSLRYVVVDECHSYRGVFGSNVALVLRRLRRLCARYGSDPVVVLASATSADPAPAASRLIGAPVAAVVADGSACGARTVALWEPPLLDGVTGEQGAPVRRSPGAEASRIMADLVVEGARTLTFVRSRRGAELTALGTARLLRDVDATLAERVAAYRAGYLAEDRRDLEARLDDGRLLGVATTNALELGVDIAGLDAVVVAGYPGTVASFWQQAGRAGRQSQGSLVVLVARDDPMDTYLVHHPAALLDRPVEATVTDPQNPYVLGPHLACAAAEQPLTPAEVEQDWGGAFDVLAELVADGVLRRRPRGWYVAAGQHPHDEVNIRGAGGLQVAIVEGSSGRLLGTVEAGKAPSTVHPGAVHLHRGESYVVDELHLDDGLALVHAEDPEWTTRAQSDFDIRVVRTLEWASHGAVDVGFAEVDVTSRVVGYLRTLPGGELLDAIELDMPEHTLRTRAVVYTLAESLADSIGVADLPGALHAAEHAAIGLLPLVATCDRGDIGGVSTALHPDTGRPTVFVYDGHPGGAGFAERGHGELARWLQATRDAIAACECPAGCPSCVQSPKCGNGNDPLDKAGAVRVLDAVLSAVAASA